MQHCYGIEALDQTLQDILEQDILSPPASVPSWTEWSHAWGGEMRLKKALEKLNLEYPHDSD
jgi:hypothetical protein